MRDYQKYATIVAVFATVLFAALLVAAFGMVSLVTNLDVIADREVGTLVGPTMSAAVVLLVFVMMLLLGVNTPPEKQRVAVGWSLATGAGAFVLYVVTGVVLVGASDGDAVGAMLFGGAMVVNPFALTAGILAFVVTLVYSILLASHYGENGRPLWPWERRGE
ncbi:hypothetical protein K2F54_17610 [Cryobacterium sp. 1639]|uniref:DUF6121 family protein n=1 Tax=Cryobacterium inferilacus TaxID=2866629 RepID=UPI001C72A855|nr:DUF6121 family protein [Cryobacterium sp. 1639]MBX0301784.1 hypothetical protein [Cryobacterium sp. 1639]